MARILVADDHDLVRMGIVRMLGDVDGIEVVGEAKTGEEAIELCQKLLPDVVLMDSRMPGIGGIEATRKLTTVCEKAKVIAVTSLSDQLTTERFVKAGATGYVTKGAGFDEIISAIETVLKGSFYMSTDIARQVAVRNYTGEKADVSPFSQLSDREMDTAIAIANGIKVNEIADRFNVSPKTINSYRYRIFEKLKIRNDVELAILAVKHKVLDVDDLP